MMMQKGMKSLQLSLNELIPKLGLSSSSVSNVAYVKAKKKFKHTAFIELNRIAVVETMYEDGDYKTYKGFRILATDGSKIQLPDTDELKEEFGVMTYNNKAHNVSGEHVFALGSVLYDVLNRIALDARLLPCKTYEVTAAREHLKAVRGLAPAMGGLTSKDIATYDRGYHSYLTMAATIQAGAQFLVRCKRGSGMKVVDEILDGKGDDDRIETVTMPGRQAGRGEYKGLPTSLTVRFVRVELDTGEYEVLATSVLDHDVLTLADLKELYHLRWGIETFYGVMKTRLVLENFSGYSAETIRQDFFSTVFLCGMESIFIMDAEEELGEQKGGYPKKVNKAVSFSAIKARAFELFLSDKPIDETLEELTELFHTSPTIVRSDRNTPRVKPANGRILAFWQRRKKMVF
jgi:hypothetical protein